MAKGASKLYMVNQFTWPNSFKITKLGLIMLVNEITIFKGVTHHLNHLLEE
jgi:hypothetical protein